MDRNIRCHLLNIPAGKVALRKESVDRNNVSIDDFVKWQQSLSARRAWIEIASGTLSDTSDVVALRKESVDRNFVGCIDRAVDIMSLSARRAWIEIPAGCWRDARRSCRSPQGERG